MPIGQYPRKTKCLQWLIEALKIQTDECQLWPFAKRANRYGHMLYEGKGWAVHRLAKKLTSPNFDPSLFCLHDCPGGDNPLCFNPRHTFQGTQADNVADCIAKGRFGRRKLKEKDVLEIRRLYSAGSHTMSQLADLYKCCFQNIHSITSRKNWKSI